MVAISFYILLVNSPSLIANANVIWIEYEEAVAKLNKAVIATGVVAIGAAATILAAAEIYKRLDALNKRLYNKRYYKAYIDKASNIIYITKANYLCRAISKNEHWI